MQTSPFPTRGREAGWQQLEPERGKLGPRDSKPYQTVSRLPVANQVFLGSWTVDICLEGRSQRLTLQRRHMAHLRRCSHITHRKLNSWDQGGDKMYCTWGECPLEAPGRLSF